MASEGLQGEEQFHSKNKLLEMPSFHAKMRLKSAPQKLNILMANAVKRKKEMGKKKKRNSTFLDRQLVTLMLFHVLQTLNKSTI